MRPIELPPKKGPEAKIQEEIVAYLRIRQWIVKETHGNMYQHGFPDIYAAHAKYGARWIEVKNPVAYSFTPGQLEFFPLLASANIGVWILVAATQDEYLKLWQPANYYEYLQSFQTITRKRIPSFREGAKVYVPKYPIVNKPK